MAKNDTNMWAISLAVIAIVAIVAVFGLVRMTGYTFFSSTGEVPASAGGTYWSQSYMLEYKLLMVQMQTEKELKQQYGSDISVVWMEFVYGNKAMVGGIVLNPDGSYNADASAALGQILEGKVMSAPGLGNYQSSVASPNTVIKAIGAGGGQEQLGIGTNTNLS